MMFQYCAYVCCDFVIDREAQVLTIKTKKKKNWDDKVAKAMQGMAKMGMED
jgi:uncharacterized protein YutD